MHFIMSLLDFRERVRGIRNAFWASNTWHTWGSFSLRCGHRPWQTGRTMLISQLRWGVGWKRWWQEELFQKSKRFIAMPCREVSRGMGEAVGKSRSRSHLWEGLRPKLCTAGYRLVRQLQKQTEEIQGQHGDEEHVLHKLNYNTKHL